MKRMGWAAGFVFVCAIIVSARAQSPEAGPGEGDAVLKDPYAPKAVRPPDRPATPAPSVPGSTHIEKTLFGKGPATTPPSVPFDPGAPMLDDGSGRPKGIAALKPSAKDDLNKDIAVTPAHGPWMISVMSYVGPEAPTMARELAIELREKYKLHAWVFNYGTEERTKEYNRVMEIYKAQQEALKDSKLALDQKVRIRYTNIPEQCAVLLSGYTTEDAALRDLKGRIKKLPCPDPKKVKLDQRVFAEYLIKDREGNDHSQKYKEYKPPLPARAATVENVNPFERAFVARNPTIKVERNPEGDAVDLATLKKLNDGEPYSLLECKRPLTLAITHFRTPTEVEGTMPTRKAGVLGALGFGRKKEREDYAATNANLLAKDLRKHFKLDAYVLHTRYNSIVTIGGYDTIEDPNLRTMKTLVQTKLRLPMVEMFPEPYLMKVPR